MAGASRGIPQSFLFHRVLRCQVHTSSRSGLCESGGDAGGGSQSTPFSRGLSLLSMSTLCTQSHLRSSKEPPQGGTGSHVWARAPPSADPRVPWGWGLQALAYLPWAGGVRWPGPRRWGDPDLDPDPPGSLSLKPAWSKSMRLRVQCCRFTGEGVALTQGPCRGGCARRAAAGARVRPHCPVSGLSPWSHGFHPNNNQSGVPSSPLPVRGSFPYPESSTAPQH